MESTMHVLWRKLWKDFKSAKDVWVHKRVAPGILSVACGLFSVMIEMTHHVYHVLALWQ